MFGQNTIKARVISAVKQKIKDAEDLYKDKCLAIDNQLDADIKELEMQIEDCEKDAVTSKAAFADLLVNDILKKII